MIQFKETAVCSCGHEFDWVTTKPGKGELIFGEIDKQNQNVLFVEKMLDTYHITLKCPHCNKKIFVTKANVED